MALPPCHAFFQFYVAAGRLSCQLYQRSCDIFLGVPFNIASYALLTHMVAQQCDLDVGDFVWTGGDCHLYLNHLEQVEMQLAREPYPLPRLIIHRRADYAIRLPVRRFRDCRLPVPSGDQGTHRGLRMQFTPRKRCALPGEITKKPAGRKIAGKGDRVSGDSSLREP